MCLSSNHGNMDEEIVVQGGHVICPGSHSQQGRAGYSGSVHQIRLKYITIQESSFFFFF